MLTTITAAKGTAKRQNNVWRRGVFALLVLALLMSGFVGRGTGIAHASARLLPPAVSSQRADAAPALSVYKATPYIGWTGTNTAHSLNLMTYNSTTKVFGPAQMLAETTLAGSGPSLTTWNSTLYVAWRGTDNRLNVGALLHERSYPRVRFSHPFLVHIFASAARPVCASSRFWKPQLAEISCPHG
jgi:hypothetical protein